MAASVRNWPITELCVDRDSTACHWLPQESLHACVAGFDVASAQMSNRPEAIDGAFLRKGRFDLQIEIKYPGETQAGELLSALLSDRPHVPGLVRQLIGRPASDIDWTVNEAARLAVRAGKDAIDDICLFNALGRLKKEQAP